MIRRELFGWFDPKIQAYRLSKIPPDCPIRPCLTFETKEETREFIQRKRAIVHWWPPLPNRVAEWFNAAL